MDHFKQILCANNNACIPEIWRSLEDLMGYRNLNHILVLVSVMLAYSHCKQQLRMQMQQVVAKSSIGSPI